MNLRPGLRSSVVILFLALYLTSLFILNAFFINKQIQSNQAFKNLKFDQALSSLTFKTQEDSILARQLMHKFGETMAVTEMLQHEARIYSATYLLVLMVISIIIFVFILYYITRPLKELQNATANISHGDFSVQLPETGIKEIRELKASFNRMSRELVLVQNKLLTAEKETIWKELSRILAHEIKNPLTPIQLSVQRLEEKFSQDFNNFRKIFPEAVNIMNQEILNLQTLAQSFSNFAKDIEPQFAIFDPRNDITRIVEPYHHKYNIKIIFATDCLIRFDPTHFYQILTNILQNAIDASSPGGKIAIITSMEEHSFVLSITDEGKGIADADLPRIFEPYFTKKKKGTGLGLALVQKLVAINNATIAVESKLEEGSTFIIRTKRLYNENTGN
ncbi:MAG: HAMP domain-containing histidine kinase [Candidatus Cloacimonetes bacterium]|nr:HAMP domain-containing histidine kinase [Candidatus Cloacimonadota bacterium]